MFFTEEVVAPESVAGATISFFHTFWPFEDYRVPLYRCLHKPTMHDPVTPLLFPHSARFLHGEP